MNCPNCGHPVRAGAKFCEECGIVLPVTAATETAQPGTATQPAAGPVAPTRRAEPYQAQAASGEETAQEHPSGTTMLPPANIGQARRTFALVAVGLIALLCCCCAGATGILIYYITQP